MVDSNISISPLWKQAVDDFKKEGFKAGSLITIDWMYEHFGIEKPKGMIDVAKHDKIKLEFLGAYTRFEDELLEECNIALRRAKGGKTVVPAGEQADFAMDEAKKGVRKSLRKGSRRITFTDTSLLTAEERLNHTNQAARMGGLESVFKKARRIEVFGVESKS